MPQQQIHSYNAQTHAWQQVSGALKEIATGSATASWGVNAAESIYSYNTKPSNGAGMPGKLKQLGMGADGVAWGFNDTGAVYRYHAGTGAWNAIGGSSLAAIAVGADEVVWGLKGSQIYRAH
jgi:hypothetical protein